MVKPVKGAGAAKLAQRAPAGAAAALEADPDDGELEDGVPVTFLPTTPHGTISRETYNKLAAKYPLLTREEEVELAKEIEDGLAAKARLDEAEARPLSAAEREALGERMGRGVAAERKLCLSCLRLVVSIAYKVKSTLPYPELVQEGNMGLLRAARKFDWRHGYRFSTYAYNWVHASMMNANSQLSRTVRLPMSARRQMSLVAAARAELEVQLERNPTVAELSQQTGITTEKISTLMEFRYDTTKLEGMKEWQALEATSTEECSYSQFMNEEDKQTFTKDLLPQLDKKERLLLELQYGLNDNEPHTIAAIVKILKIRRNEYKKLKQTALWRLSRLDKGMLKNFYETLTV
jgi:RNA polymerase sigma factor (sigma-70 family)